MPPDRRLVFGRVAELYDRARPAYPPVLVDEVLRFAGAGDGDRALEVGSGTGKATELFATRGLNIVALEPSEEMLRVARRRLVGHPRVQLIRTEFESWDPETSSFRLVYSAQAWHWVAPEDGYETAARALGPGGMIAVFWNRVRWSDLGLQPQLSAAYSRTLPHFGPRPGPMHPDSPGPAHWMTDWDSVAARWAGFDPPQAREYHWSVRYSTAAYLELLCTHSDHLVLPRTIRCELLAAVAEVLDANGGGVEMPYTTLLLMARLARPKPVARVSPR